MRTGDRNHMRKPAYLELPVYRFRQIGPPSAGDSYSKAHIAMQRLRKRLHGALPER